MRAPFGLTLIFLNVLLEQLGVPLPAIPTLVLAGALAANGKLPGSAVFALAVAASLIGDTSWYLAGRAYGVRVMKLLCRISLTPDTCVSQTQSTFERWGARALIAAKFIPGLSMIAPPLAGATRMHYGRFAFFSALGAALWVGGALLAGVLLKSQIAQLLPRFAGIGGSVALIVCLLLGAYIGIKWWERRRFYALLDMTRIDVDELYERMQGESAPLIVDVRSATSVELERRRIPGAMSLPVQEVERQVRSLPRDREIILYCNCPNEASAAQAAKVLLNQGFRQVRPLRGGLDAWIAAGYAVEESPAAAARVPAVAAISAPPLP
jgi:membrane protein DedA with SNARE-associated domain/rhodanese-related sulfurtransferase